MGNFSHLYFIYYFFSFKRGFFHYCDIVEKVRTNKDFWLTVSAHRSRWKIYLSSFFTIKYVTLISNSITGFFREILLNHIRSIEFSANSAPECFIPSTPFVPFTPFLNRGASSFKHTHAFSEWNPIHKTSSQISQHASERERAYNIMWYKMHAATRAEDEKTFLAALARFQSRAPAIRKCARNCPHYQDESEFHANATLPLASNKAIRGRFRRLSLQHYQYCSANSSLRRAPRREGRTFNIQSGTPHALAAGQRLYIESGQ